MRRIAAVTAEHVHCQLHGRAKGHAVVRPAAERAAGEDQGGTVTDDVTEQTQNASDVMAMEDGQTGDLLRGREGDEGGGGGVADGGEGGRGREPSGCGDCAGGSRQRQAQCHRCGPAEGGGSGSGGLGESGRAIAL